MKTSLLHTLSLVGVLTLAFAPAGHAVEIIPITSFDSNTFFDVADFTKNPEFEGNVDVIDTRDFWRDAAVSPVSQGFHWNQNGETMFLIGKSMGDRMANLLDPSD